MRQVKDNYVYRQMRTMSQYRVNQFGYIAGFFLMQSYELSAYYALYSRINLPKTSQRKLKQHANP